MSEFYLKTLHELEAELKLISFDYDNQATMCDMSLKSIVKHLAILKNHVLENGFENQEQEIDFFKNIKPKFTSKLIYFTKVQKLEIRKPVGGKKKQIKFLQKELDKLNLHFVENQYFYNYMRSGDDFFDDRIFVRDNNEIDFNLEVFHYEMDPRFSTTHDFKVAYILANDFFQKHIENKIISLMNNTPSFVTSPIANKKLKWNYSKRAAGELIYALHALGVFNNGNVSIMDITKYFEEVFDVKLGYVHGIKGEIKGRRKDKVKFLAKLVEAYAKCMEE